MFMIVYDQLCIQSHFCNLVANVREDSMVLLHQGSLCALGNVMGYEMCISYSERIGDRPRRKTTD